MAEVDQVVTDLADALIAELETNYDLSEFDTLSHHLPVLQQAARLQLLSPHAIAVMSKIHAALSDKIDTDQLSY